MLGEIPEAGDHQKCESEDLAKMATKTQKICSGFLVFMAPDHDPDGPARDAADTVHDGGTPPQKEELPRVPRTPARFGVARSTE